MSVPLGGNLLRDKKKRKRDYKSKSKTRISDKVLEDTELTECSSKATTSIISNW